MHIRLIIITFIGMTLVACQGNMEGVDNLQERLSTVGESKDPTDSPNTDNSDVNDGDTKDDLKDENDSNNEDQNPAMPDPQPDPPKDPKNAQCIRSDEVCFPNDKDQIIIEVEDHEPVGGYAFKNNVQGYMGEGFLVYTNSDKPSGGSHKYDGESELTFKYYIPEDGKYTFAFRAARYDGGLNYKVESGCSASSTDCTRPDLNNDAFLGTTGRSPVKMYIPFEKTKDSWHVGGTLDFDHMKIKPTLSLQEGIHTLIIRGRSNLFALDRVYIYGSDKPDEKDPASIVMCNKN